MHFSLKNVLKHPGKALGNLVKNISPLAAFTPIGALGAAGLAVGGGLLRHEKPGQLVKSGLSNAALGGGLASIGGKVGIGSGAHLGFGLGEHAAAAAPSLTTGASTTAAPSWTATTAASPLGLAGDGASVALDSAPTVGASVVPGVAASGSGFLSKVGKVLDFAEAHPNTASGALNAVASIPGQNTESRLRNAQATTLEQQADESAYDFAQRKRREELLAPVWSALGTTEDGYSKIAPNPYSVG